MFWRSDLSLDKGPYSASLKRGELIDTARLNEDGSVRSVAFKLYQPNDVPADAKVPLIIWSHGFGGSRDGAGFLARYIASYGYALLHITHTGTDSSLWEGKPGHPWEILKKTQVSRSTTLNRFYDVAFVLDEFPAWVQGNGDDALKAQLDLTQIGMSGHSFGALTTQVLAGQLTPDLDNKLMSLHDERIISSIAYSPVPGVSHLSNEVDEANATCIYETIEAPLLHMTGTDDSSPINNMPYNDRLKIYDRSRLASKALLVKQNGDHMVYNGTRGALASNPLRDKHEEMINVISLAWWDAWLKNDEDAMNWLQSDACKLYLGADNDWKIDGL